jgi:phosphoenolpyruvate carboxykinase (ATP)
VAKMVFKAPEARRVLRNLTQAELHELTAQQATARSTEYAAVNVQTMVLARSKGSTFIVSDNPAEEPHQAIDRDEWERVSALQDAYIADQEMVEVDGFIGNDPDHRVPARLLVESRNVNIAGMQDVLYFHDPDAAEEFEPELLVIYTPNLAVPGYPDDRLIAVNLDLNVTRVFNSDYFGESKKGGLRMWNRLVYERGGLPLHAGCKTIPTPRGDRVGMIVGLSGTGKTTTTFTRQNGSLPVQDDFVAWWPTGHVTATEAGCFAKTFALNPKDEPTIYGAVTKPAAYLENVSMDDRGQVDFFDESYTKNGRAVFSFSAIESADGSDIKPDFLLILNRNENVIPAVAKVEGPQAAAFFMLGETTGTAAGGKDEEGVFLRVPGTNPFFPMHHDHQGNRFLELLERHPIDVYIMNTGRVGGGPDVTGSKKVLIPHSSAIVKAIAEGTIEWTDDLDFGYKVAAAVPGIEASEIDILQPRRLYEATGRAAEYAERVARLKAERAVHLSQFDSLSHEIVNSVG